MELERDLLDTSLTSSFGCPDVGRCVDILLSRQIRLSAMDNFRDLVIPSIFRHKLYLLSRVSMAFALEAISYLPISTMHFQFPHSYVKREMKKAEMPFLMLIHRVSITKYFFLRWQRQWLSSSSQRYFLSEIFTAQEIVAANTCQEVC